MVAAVVFDLLVVTYRVFLRVSINRDLILSRYYIVYLDLQLRGTQNSNTQYDTLVDTSRFPTFMGLPSLGSKRDRRHVTAPVSWSKPKTPMVASGSMQHGIVAPVSYTRRPCSTLSVLKFIHTHADIHRSQGVPIVHHQHIAGRLAVSNSNSSCKRTLSRVM